MIANADPAHDAVGARSGRHLEDVAVGFRSLHRIREIDGSSVKAYVDSFHRPRCRYGETEHKQDGNRVDQTQERQTPAPPCGPPHRIVMGSRRLWREQGLSVALSGTAAYPARY